MQPWRNTTAADAELPSGLRSASVVSGDVKMEIAKLLLFFFGISLTGWAYFVSGDVMEIAKLLLFFFGITLTASGLYRNIWRGSAVQSQASSTLNSSAQAESIAIPRAMESLNSIEGPLEDMLMSVVSSDNNYAMVPNSTNASMVVLEMASLAPPLPA